MKEEKGLDSVYGLKVEIPKIEGEPFGKLLKEGDSSWLDYYIYAQHLYNSGNRDKAEVYYHHAQKLYYKEDIEHTPEYHNAGPTIVGPPAAAHPSPERSLANPPKPMITVSPAPKKTAQTREPTESEPIVLQTEPDSHSQTSTRAEDATDTYVDLEKKWAQFAEHRVQEDLPSTPDSKRSVRKILGWSALLSSLLLLAGFGWLFHLYQYQKMNGHAPQTEIREAKASLFSSLVDPQKKNESLQGVLAVLEPAFDKVSRILVSAKPLLRELGLKETALSPTAYGSQKAKADASSASPAGQYASASYDKWKEPLVEESEIDLDYQEQCSQEVPSEPCVTTFSTEDSKSSNETSKTRLLLRSKRNSASPQKQLSKTRKGGKKSSKYKKRRRIRSFARNKN